VPDPELGGHYIRVSPTGVKSYVAVAKGGKQVWRVIGTTDAIIIAEARRQAVKVIEEIKAGDIAQVPADTLGAVAESWLKQVVEARGHRTAAETRRIVSPPHPAPPRRRHALHRYPPLRHQHHG
jgi:hypothetical protein